MDNEETLRVRAYYLWEAAGRPEGAANLHWAQARRDTALIAETATDILSAETLAQLERDLLPGYLLRRRWFGAKNRTIEGLSVVEPVTIGDAGILAQIEVRAAGGVERYALPLAIVWDDSDAPYVAREMAIVGIRSENRLGVLTDAFFTPPFIQALLTGTHGGCPMKSHDEGKLEFTPESAAWDAIDKAGEIRWLSTEQSNTSVVVGNRIVMKLMRRLQAGVHPEAEMCRFLTRAGYQNASPLLAEVAHTDSKGESRSMFVLEGFVANQGDAWTHAVECLQGIVRENGETKVFERIVEVVGRRLGELHAVLLEAHDDAAFDAEAVQEGDIEAWKEAAIEQVERALDAAGKHEGDLLIGDLMGSRAEIVDAVSRAQFEYSGAAKTRIHGDFHLGQVLWSGTDAYIIDFEGEPARPVESRRAKSSPLRDVAGLLRSLDYAAAFAAQAEGRTDREPSLDALIRDAEDRFLRAYRQAGGTEIAAPSSGDRISLLDLFLLEKCAYEVCYEAANRPDWISIPLQGMARVLQAFPDLVGRRTASPGE
ncbi:putative maltokinase [Caballeronia sp. GaOx3]|uniref:putative maltokinase n=1 Tax=Caballeronia sp. GaOx3 TaxID=2921740 RepID=UPI002027B0E8|nr:putative maltokinase [Caballeronia sp. GaOx3]